MRILRAEAAGYLFAEGYGFQSFQPMLGPEIAYRGQPIALVVADTLEAAIEGQRSFAPTYQAEPFAVTLDGPGAETIDQAAAIPIPMFADRVAGDADTAFAAADVQIDAVYEGPPQHQNPIELLTTVAEWRDGTLTVSRAFAEQWCHSAWPGARFRHRAGADPCDCLVGWRRIRAEELPADAHRCPLQSPLAASGGQ